MGKPNLGYQDLERLNQSPEMQKVIEEEFGTAMEGVSRRRWLQLMGASLALGAAAGCRFQPEKIVPYAFRPQNRIPGTPVRYATLIELDGFAQPVEALSFDGRPIKLDGNRMHPMTKNLSENSPGTSSAFTQNRILDLYDPDRLRSPLKQVSGGNFEESNWGDFIAALRGLLGGNDLKSVAVLAEPSASPSLHKLREQFESRGGTWTTFAPLGDDNTREGSRLAFGKVVRSHYAFDKAKVVVCLDADPLHFDGAAMKHSREFAAARDVEHIDEMNRLYCVESDNSITGSSADHRMSLPSSKIGSFLGSLAAEVEKWLAGNGKLEPTAKYRSKLLIAMASDLVENKGAGMVIVGERQPPEVHAAAHKLNDLLGNNGSTITFSSPIDAERSGMMAGLRDLTSGLASKKFTSLVILGGNPVYDAPADLKLSDAISACENSIHLSYYANETSKFCNWVFNVSHPLESWGDGLSYDGTWCLAQPLVSPLFEGRSAIEVLASAMSDADVDGQTIVAANAKEKFGESGWTTALHNGFFMDSAGEAVSVSLETIEFPGDDGKWRDEWDGKLVEMVFTPSRSVYDGRFANSGWMQELPDFVTKITWDNAALVSPETAEKLGLKQDRLYPFSFNGDDVTLPVHIQPGQAKGSIAIAIGYGRTAAGAIGGHRDKNIAPVGFDVATLRNSENWYINESVEVTKNSGTSYPLAVVQENWAIDSVGREEIQRRMFVDPADGTRSNLIREGSFDSFKDFQSKQDSHGDDHGDSHASTLGRTVKQVAATGTALPIINAVFRQEDGHQGDSHDDHDHGAADDHGHGEQHNWPNFHEHELFDLTPGVREQYKSSNTENKNSWGMSIDLNKCTGCNSCVIACQSENNIPIVGKDQVYRGREMHWMRIDRYFGNNLYNAEAAESDDKQIVHQPVACHHCENAPCETVCPVAATTHSSEGLNDMVYNRCIGTRYCGNNCPYKVRRFNYLNYSDAVTFVKYPDADRLSKADRALQNLMMNPEVTVRSRGVMEKCSYCVQRIQNVKIVAKGEGNRPIGPNEITTACQDSCPTGAIKFGDINNTESDLHKAHNNPRSYAMLSELNNYPRTKYLARVRNPHPSLMDMDDRGERKRKMMMNATPGAALI
ncbi:MAG: 4Fe-4S dicluster domain-containing protein [Pirellulaceae bacterium]